MNNTATTQTNEANIYTVTFCKNGNAASFQMEGTRSQVIAWARRERKYFQGGVQLFTVEAR